MTTDQFRTATGRRVPAVTATEMRRVDRVATEEVGLDLLQMMENAGRALAWHTRDIADGPVTVVAGGGGNGGGGLACARHLSNRGVPVEVVLDRPPGALTGAAAHQHRTLSAMGVPTHESAGAVRREPAVIVDALVGYGLEGGLRPPAAALVEAIGVAQAGDGDKTVVSLDVPTGRDATTGDADGPVVAPTRTVTLAAPKTGLDEGTGSLWVADVGIPAVVYERAGVAYESPFDGDWVELVAAGSE